MFVSARSALSLEGMSTRHQVILVPGFFAFSNLGDMRYFLGVSRELERQLASRGVEADIVEVVTLPTASIRHRAAKVLDEIHGIMERCDGPIHVIGHSTGGLDARLAVAPTASLPTTTDSNRAYERVSTLITIAAPHFGTPLATYYGSAMGKPLLQLLALATVYILRYGRLPLGVAIKLGGLFARLDDYVGLNDNIVDQLYNELLADFNDERREAVLSFLHDIRTDQSLIFQLTPAALDLFNATSADPNRIRYGSVVTRARSPKLGAALGYGVNPYALSMYTVYSGLWWVASRSNPQLLASPDAAQALRMTQSYGALPASGDNDGVVPTLSQVWGPVIHAARGDHLDVVGHYGQSRQVDGVYADWLPTASGFDDAAFEAVWSDVADFIVGQGG